MDSFFVQFLQIGKVKNFKKCGPKRTWTAPNPKWPNNWTLAIHLKAPIFMGSVKIKLFFLSLILFYSLNIIYYLR